MPRKKQQCGFRIPWISGPSTESHSPRPNQKSKSSSTHRPPFRPPGIASTPPQGTPKTQPKKVSKSLPSHSPAPSVIIDSPEPNVKELELELELDTTSTQDSNSNSNAPLETQSKPNPSESNTINNIKREPSIPKPKNSDLDETAEKKQTMMFATSTPPSGENKKVVTPSNKNVSTISLSNEENPTTKKNMNLDDDISGLNPTLNVDDKTVSVVTLAGDNRGVTMHVAGSQRPKPEGSSSNTTEKKDEAGKTYVNSNIQSINNSIMSHGSINGRDPGVRVIHPHPPQPQPEVKQPKVEVNLNRVEKVPYQPVVRRRCLRGLLLESSDSDPDNPNKPRRHGCKVRCGDNNIL